MLRLAVAPSRGKEENEKSCDQQCLYLLSHLFFVRVFVLYLHRFPPLPLLFKFFPFVSIIAFSLSRSVISKQSTLAYRGEGVGWGSEIGFKETTETGDRVILDQVIDTKRTIGAINGL